MQSKKKHQSNQVSNMRDNWIVASTSKKVKCLMIRPGKTLVVPAKGLPSEWKDEAILGGMLRVKSLKDGMVEITARKVLLVTASGVQGEANDKAQEVFAVRVNPKWHAKIGELQFLSTQTWSRMQENCTFEYMEVGGPGDPYMVAYESEALPFIRKSWKVTSSEVTLPEGYVRDTSDIRMQRTGT